MNTEEISTFFRVTSPNIFGNGALREPQREAYAAVCAHFETDSSPCYVQLPVGCGKTGLIGMTPFANSHGRVLIVAPNVTIRTNIVKELDISNPNNFFGKRGVLTPPLEGPFVTELRTGANHHDCDNAHIVVANVQQFSGANNKWYERFERDYFSMVLVDEGHHNVLSTTHG